jgi:hypothetical protein
VIPDERPAVLLVPGFLGSPPMYGRFADRLLARGAASVTGSRCVKGAPVGDPDLRRRIVGHFYALLGGHGARTDWGDGLILEAATHLEGARNVTLERIIHAPGLPVPWYGSDEGLDGWWDVAVEAWREARQERSTPSVGNTMTAQRPLPA